MANSKKGEKQYVILSEVQKRGGMRYMEIIEFIFKFNNPSIPWDKLMYRGYYSGIFIHPNGYPWSNTSTGWGKILLDKVGNQYKINQKGIDKLNELQLKFGK